MIYELAVENFLKVVKADCKAHGVKLWLPKRTHIPLEGESLCNGYFHEGDDFSPIPTLAVSTKKPPEMWLRTLVHEWSHMQQWKEKCKTWTDDEKYGVLWHEWVAKEAEASPEKVRRACMSAMMNELDCEQRSAKAIAQYALPLNLAHYVQQANAYVLFYHAARKRRQWYTPGKEPYNIFSIVESMSTAFDMNYKRITRAQDALFEQCFLQPSP